MELNQIEKLSNHDVLESLRGYFEKDRNVSRTILLLFCKNQRRNLGAQIIGVNSRIH
jgi:hypothetical protein